MNELSIKISEPTSLVDQIAEGLREAILSGILTPGEKLKENEISVKLGVSRSPTRDALHILNMEGLVDLIPRRGAYVHKITIEDVKDAYQIREMIEGYSGGIATKIMSDHDIDELEKLWLKMKSLAKEKDINHYQMVSSDFHSKIIACSQNKRLADIYYNLRNLIKFLRSYALIHTTRINFSLQEHKAIVEAFKSRDKHLVVKLSQEHVRKGQNHLITFLKENNIFR